MFHQIFFIIVTIILLLKWLERRPKNLPPGEWGLPVVGYAPFMKRKLSKTIVYLKKKHGNIFTIKIGSRVFVILTDYHMIKTAFQKAEISGRPSFYHFSVARKNPHLGILHSDGRTWTVNRRFAVKTLREFGLGEKSVLDGTILNEAQSLIEVLKKDVNKPIEVNWYLNVAVMNVIWRLVANRSYDIFDEEIARYIKNINDNMIDKDEVLAIFGIFPWLIPIIPKIFKEKWMREADIVRRREEILKLIMDIIKEHKKTLDLKNPRDYIDKYLIELQEKCNDEDYQHWGDEDLEQNVYDFFIAGSESSSSTLRWFFLYMAKFQKVQKKVQQEIDQNIQKETLPSFLDRDLLPSLEALTLEISRHISLVPQAVPHEASQDTTLKGYDIPKGTIVLCDVDSCHRNPKFWKYPNDFCIENFLDENGKVIQNKEGYLPFSLGRHMCPGDKLAKMELFVFMGAILQNFEILEPTFQNASLAPLDNVNTLNVPPKFKVILKKRN